MQCTNLIIEKAKAETEMEKAEMEMEKVMQCANLIMEKAEEEMDQAEMEMDSLLKTIQKNSFFFYQKIKTGNNNILVFVRLKQVFPCPTDQAGILKW